MTECEATHDFRIRLAFWVLGASLGFSQAWISRLDADDNAVAYLDIGRYFFHGHYSAIINGFWSPLYSFLCGLTIAVFRPSMYWEYPAMHGLVFVIFLFTMPCFDYFLRQLVKFRADVEREREYPSESGWVWVTLGYAIFLYSTLEWTKVDRVTTDLLAAGFFYLSFGFALKIASGRESWKVYSYLGLTLGLAYLTKFLLLPICLLILVMAWLVAKPKAHYVTISAIALLFVAAPYIIALSIQKGRFTYGEANTYGYAVNLNRIPSYHWQGEASMPLVHPTRQIFESPDTFEFKEPFKGTYPPQYDITYWYEGIKPQVHLHQQLQALGRNLRLEFGTLNLLLGGIFVPTLFLTLYDTGRGRRVSEDVRRYWFLIVPCVAMAILFALVYYEPLYLAGAFVVLVLCLFSSAIARPGSRVLAGVAVLYFAMLVGLVVLPSFLHVFDVHPFHDAGPKRPYYFQVAEAALQMGLRPGDQIASANDSNFGMSEWAHLAHIEIIAEIPYVSGVPDGDPYDVWNRRSNYFWKADALTQEKVLQKFSQTGARAVVSQDKPTGAGASGWAEMGNTGYYLYWLKPAD
jgi:hypothetical protein